MKNKKLIFFQLFSIIWLNLFSQINYKNGYYIDNSRVKHDCLIKNIEWKKSPNIIYYKTHADSESFEKNISELIEFGIYNETKFIKAKIKIELSSDMINNLEHDRNPKITEKEEFVRVLIDGKYSLYILGNDQNTRFYYSIDGNIPELLVFKKYLNNINVITQKNDYLFQIRSLVSCENFDFKKFENLKYEEKTLVKIFEDLNNCSQSNLQIFYKPKQIFALSVRPRVQFSNIYLNNTTIENKFGYGLGIEGEIFLPFRNKKWSIPFEPSFQHLAVKVPNGNIELGNDGYIDLKYNTFEISTGLRHYFYLNERSTVFVNGNFNFIIDNTSNTLNIKSADVVQKYPVNSKNNWAFGMGYKWKNQFGLEVKYYTKKDILIDVNSKYCDHKRIDLIFSYNLF